jgi:hypothetical protein
MPYMQVDPHVKNLQKNEYVVRTLYYDTPDLRFYYEKIDGINIRKKIRIRVYDEYFQNVTGFLEIKRRINNIIAKERIQLPFSEIEQMVQFPERQTFNLSDTQNGRKVVSKFLYNILRDDLRPTVLIVYERAPYVGLLDNEERLTIDSNVHASPFPDIDEIFTDSGRVLLAAGWSVLEFKFNRFMPKWMRSITREFGLMHCSVSKYCMGIDACVLEKL